MAHINENSLRFQNIVPDEGYTLQEHRTHQIRDKSNHFVLPKMSMQELRLSEVPEYLRGGELYKSLVENSEDPNEKLSFETSVLKQNTHVESTDDCDHLMNSLRFWGVTQMCDELAAFVLSNQSEGNDMVLAKYEEQFPYARALRRIKKTYFRKKKSRGQISDAVETGCVEVVEYLLRGKRMLPQIDACMLAAREGHLGVLIFVHQRGYTISHSVAEIAVVLGRVDFLEYVHRQITLTDSLLFKAADNGRLTCLQYLHGIGCKWNRLVCCHAAQSGHLDCLQYAHENGCPWRADTCHRAALGGKWNCLQYAHENGCRWTEETAHAAAESGSAECLQYVLENGCTINADTCMRAARCGRLHSLQYLHEHDIPWDRRTCEAAATYGHIECLKYAHMHGCPWNESTCNAAATGGHLNCLEYAHENGCNWNKDTYAAAVAAAVYSGDLECLNFLRARCCPHH